jgi:hypothetical protein
MRDTGQDTGRTPATVREAAEILGISKEAVRKRISRGTLHSDKAPDGAVRVFVPPSPTVRSVGQPTSASDTLMSEMRARISSLEHQLEAERQANSEHRRLLAAALERIPPQLEARESSLSTEEGPEREDPAGAAEGAQEATSAPWWRRILGS